MDYQTKDAPKYPDVSANQPGLEVDSRPVHDPRYGSAGFIEKPEGKGGRKILGLSVGVFWAIVLVCALAIGGGVGGGVGAGLAAQKKSCDGNSSSPTRTITETITSTPGVTATRNPSSSTSTRPSKASVSPAPVSPCTDNPSVNGTTITPLYMDGNPYSLTTGGSQSFRVYCNTNWPGGAAYGNPQLRDMMILYLPTLEECMAACAAYNVGYVKSRGDGVAVGGGLCRAVAVVLADGDGCYLKNGTGRNDTSSSGGAKIDSALLL